MADGSGIPSWLTEVGTTIGAFMGVILFTASRHDRLNDAIAESRKSAADEIEAAKLELEARQAALRTEVFGQTAFVLGRLNELSDSVVRRGDLTGLERQLQSVSERVDRLLERK